MFNDGESRREARVRWQGTATIWLLVINALVFVCQNLAERYYPGFPVNPYFALSLDGLQHGFVWQLFTYQFMHGGFWHIFLNSWAIFVFGRAVEATIGAKRVLKVYLLSGIVGGLVQIMGTWLLPSLFGDSWVVGASAGAFGLVAAFAVLYPNERLFLLLFFIIPLRMKATTLLWLSVAMAVFGIILPAIAPFVPHQLANSDLFSNVAHAAHLGGIATGYLFARRLLRGYRPLSPMIEPPPIIQTGAKSSLKITPVSD